MNNLIILRVKNAKFKELKYLKVKHPIILVRIIGNADLKTSTILTKKWFQMLGWVQDVPLQIDKLHLLKQRYVKMEGK